MPNMKLNIAIEKERDSGIEYIKVECARKEKDDACGKRNLSLIVY